MEEGDEYIDLGIGSVQGSSKFRYARISENKIMTPQENAAWNLNLELGSNFPIFSEDARQQLQDEFFELPGLKTMNMTALATTLAFLRDHPIETLSQEDFKDKIILPYIEKVLPSSLSRGPEKRRAVIRYKAQILRYVRIINQFRF